MLSISSNGSWTLDYRTLLLLHNPLPTKITMLLSTFQVELQFQCHLFKTRDKRPQLLELASPMDV